MQSINSLKNIPVDISIFCKKLDDSIFKDFRFVDLINNAIQSTGTKYNFAIYTDVSVLPSNIFVPVFHTFYLGSHRHNVIISDQKDLWLTNIFTNNKYYIIPSDNDSFDYTASGINIIKTIREIQ